MSGVFFVFTIETINKEGVFEKGVELIVIGVFAQTMLWRCSFMKRAVAVCVGSLLVLSLFSGCGKEDELTKENTGLKEQVTQLQDENKQLKDENKQLKNEVAMYVPNKQQGASSSAEAKNQPVTAVSVKLFIDVVQHAEVTFKNNTNKVIDGIEYVVIGFDNFGKPAKLGRNGNVSPTLNIQKEIQPGDTASGSWSLYDSNDQAHKGKVVVQKVHFTDGAVWVNNDFDKMVADQKDKL